MMIIAPGQWSEWKNLVEAAQDVRRSDQEEIKARLAKRRAAAAPESDDVDYDAIVKELENAARSARQGLDSEIRGHCNNVLEVLSWGVQVPADYEPVPGSADVRIRIKVVSRLEFQKRQAIAFHREAPVEALWDMLEAWVEIDGIHVEGEHEMRPAEAWDHAGLTGTIWLVVKGFQSMSFEEKKRFGSQVASTSQGSTATDAPSNSGVTAGVSTTEPSPTASANLKP